MPTTTPQPAAAAITPLDLATLPTTALLTTTEAAAALGLSPETLANRRATGRYALPYARAEGAGVKAPSTPAPLPLQPDTPEAASIPDPHLFREPLNLDAAVLCLAERMGSALTLLQVAGHDMRQGCTVSHETVVGALWLLDGQNEQLRALVRTAAGIRPQGAE